MLNIRKARDRGYSDLGWLQSRHTFSFSDYYDPDHMGFGALRVINEDTVQAGKGFGTHPHRDMEIISYVLDGELAHRDSMGNGSVIRPGDVQRMSAGTGVTHSEFNHSASAPVRFLQIWILPESRGLAPGYEQKHFAPDEKQGTLRLVASREGRDGSVSLNQDADMYASRLDQGQRVRYEISEGRDVWIQIARGSARVNDSLLDEGDGASLSRPGMVSIAGTESAEVLLFDMAQQNWGASR